MKKTRKANMHAIKKDSTMKRCSAKMQSGSGHVKSPTIEKVVDDNLLETPPLRYSREIHTPVGIFYSVPIQKKEGVDLLKLLRQQREQRQQRERESANQRMQETDNDNATINQPDIKGESIGTSMFTDASKLGGGPTINAKVLPSMLKSHRKKQIWRQDSKAHRKMQIWIDKKVSLKEADLERQDSKSHRNKERWGNIVTEKDDWELMCEKLARSN